MIIIDENTEQMLVETLVAFREAPDATRCIQFTLPPTHTRANKGWKRVVHIILQTIEAERKQLFFCEEGEVVLLASTITPKEFENFSAAMAKELGLTDNIISPFIFFDLEAHLNKFLVSVEEKLITREREILAAKRIQEEALAEQKRKMILDAAATKDAATIAQQRSMRERPEVMIIEDDVFSRKLVDNLLHKHFHVTGLGTADEALDTYTRLAPDVLFLDINLPDVTGHELLERIVTLDPNAYVIMLSGNSDKENIFKAMNKGAKGFVGKPFSKEKLLQYIERCPTIRHQHAS